MQYLLLIYRSEAELAKMDPDARQKMSAEYGAYTQSIVQSGHFKAGDGLQPSTTATTVRVRDGKLQHRERLGIALVENTRQQRVMELAQPRIRLGLVRIASRDRRHDRGHV